LAGHWAATAHAEAAPPKFVQAATGHSGSVTSQAVTPGSPVTVGNREVVEVGTWSEAAPTITSVSDSAGNGYVELLHFRASDKTYMSIWTAPITAGGGTRPTITVKPSSKADMGVVALEYAGVSSDPTAAVLDQSAFNSATTGAAETVSSGATPPTTAANELAIGFYLDSGFGDALSGGTGYTTRANLSPDGDIELLAQDAVTSAGATPNPSFATGPMTTWLASTVVLRAAGPPTAPGAPTAVNATAGNASATVSWAAPPSGNSPITSYTVTPYIGTVAQPPTTITGSPPATGTAITGLTNATAYTFTVSATNAVGAGPASAASNSVTPTTHPEGEWAPLMNWPFVAIHMFLLSSGRVLAYDGWRQPEPTYVSDPTTQEFTSGSAPDSIFCGSMAQLPNGELMTAGGYGGLTTGETGIVDTAIFNPATGTWTRVADMHFPRWYPSLTELANGDYVVISGNTKTPAVWADTPEVYDPKANTWTLLSKVSTPQVHEEKYPFSYLAPNGNVFTIGPNEDVSYELNVEKQTWTPVGGVSEITNGSSVMYRPGKILYSGGTASLVNTTPSAATTSIIDLTAATPRWQQIAPMHNARTYHTLTMLANGEVLAVGGTPTSEDTIVIGVLPTEIWNPNTETWSRAAPIAAARNYHSTAILMPNATVLIAGGGHPGPNEPGEFSAQTYSPPYLFAGPRPTITASPPASTYNANITVTTPDASSISSVNLVSLGADTHQLDMAQHFVPLSFTANSGSLTVQTPANSALAPYGNYMLFIVNNKGVPSVSAPLNLGATPSAPGAPTGVSATAAAGSATVSWTAPSAGTSPITSYTITPYIGTVAQPATTITGSPPATTATIGGLTNGTTYTFTVTATNAVGPGPASTASNPVTPSVPTAPGKPTGVSATPGNGTAIVTWAAPASNGSPITSYTITPYIGTVAQPATTISGSPPATTATIGSLKNGTTYTFTVTATNEIGTGLPSEASNTVTPTATTSPAFVQQVAGHAHDVASLSATPTTALTAGNRLVVEVGVWSSANATASSVKDSAGDTFTELLHFKASDGTEMSVWTAPVGPGGGTHPTVTATPTSTADVGIAVLEYSGLSTAAGTAAVDQTAQATGTTKAAGVVSTPPTAPTSGPNELVVGFYADSGFGDNLMAAMGFNGRANVSPTEDMELVAEDALTGAAGVTPSTGVQTGAATPWLMATVVFKPAPAAAPAAPSAAPALLVAAPANHGAMVTWKAPPNGGSQITAYTVTPYAGSHRLKSTTVSGRSAVIEGLGNGVRYRFRVAARNVLGSGPVSKFSNAVKPSRGRAWLFWCNPFSLQPMHAGALDILTPWAGEVLVPGDHSRARSKHA
jgi:hypothetical protein